MHVYIKKNMLCLYIKYIHILYEYKMYTDKYFQNIYCMCVYLHMHNKYIEYTNIYYVNKNLYCGCN